MSNCTGGSPIKNLGGCKEIGPNECLELRWPTPNRWDNGEAGDDVAIRLISSFSLKRRLAIFEFFFS